MPVLHLPGSPANLVTLAFIVASFAAFAVTLLSVSLSVALAERAQRAAERPVEREVTPARGVETASAPAATA